MRISFGFCVGKQRMPASACINPVSYTHLDVYKRQTLVILISMASTCILAEVVRAVTKYNSFKGNSIAYVIFSLGMVGSPLPIWLFKADFLAQITEQGMPADYVAAVEALSSNAMLIVLFVAPHILLHKTYGFRI